MLELLHHGQPEDGLMRGMHEHVDTYQTVEEFPLMRGHSQKNTPSQPRWNYISNFDDMIPASTSMRKPLHAFLCFAAATILSAPDLPCPDFRDQYGSDLDPGNRDRESQVPAIQAAQAQQKAAQGAVGVARTAYLPRTDLLWQTNRATANNIYGLLLPQGVIPNISGPVIASDNGRSAWSSGGGALLSWQPFDFGARSAKVKAAREGSEAARQAASLTTLEVTANAGSAFFDLTAAQQLVVVAQANVRRNEAFHQAVHVLVDNTLRPGADASQADAQLALARNQLIQAQTQEALRRSALAEYLQATGAQLEIDASQLIASLPASDLGQAAAVNHPAVLEESALSLQQEAQKRVLDRSYVPVFSTLGAVSGRGAGTALNGQFPGAPQDWPPTPSTGLQASRSRLRPSTTSLCESNRKFRKRTSRRNMPAITNRYRDVSAAMEQARATLGRRTPDGGQHTGRIGRRADQRATTAGSLSFWIGHRGRCCRSRRGAGPSRGRRRNCATRGLARGARDCGCARRLAAISADAAEPVEGEIAIYVAHSRSSSPAGYGSRPGGGAGALSILAIMRTRVDIFPNLDLPVIYVAQPYGGMSPQQMEGFISYYYEYHFLYINGIESVEAKSIQGTALLRLTFHPGTNMSDALAQTISYVNRAHAFMPPGTVSPFVIRYDAGTLPVGYMVFSSPSRTLAEIQDLALNRVRPVFATLPGVSSPPPFGGNQRTIVINVDPRKLQAYGLSPENVVQALTSGNSIQPAGNADIGTTHTLVTTDTTVTQINDLLSIPLQLGSGASVYIRDVGSVSDSSDLLAGYALLNGKRTIYIPVTKRPDASTLTVVDEVRQNLPRFQSLVPEDIKITYEFDQSQFVRDALMSVLREGIAGAILTGLMLLLFLRDWRSSVIVVITIPFALLTAVLLLRLTGQTINIMTLGGLALAVGVLVDEGTVLLENIHVHLDRGENTAVAVLSGQPGGRHSAPACHAERHGCLPSFVFYDRPAQSLFLPLSLAVGFAMGASYLLSSSLVPVLGNWMLKPNASRQQDSRKAASTVFVIVSSALSNGRCGFPVCCLALTASSRCWCSLLVTPHIAQEIFPSAASTQFRLRIDAPDGTRVAGNRGRWCAGFWPRSRRSPGKKILT